jgi:hypothetical protein
MPILMSEDKPMNDLSPIRAPLVASVHGIIPTDFESVWRMATVLCKTGMIPVNFKDKPEDTAAAIMWGMEIGLSPIVALQSIAVINGRPSLWGDVLPAMIIKAGHRLTETVEGEGSDMIATCILDRKDGHAVKRTFSMADAKRAGLASKTGPWTQYPQRMLQMRARSWAVRDGAADVLRGLQIAEEQQDIPRDITPDDGPALTGPRRTAHSVRKSGDYDRFTADVRDCKTTDELSAVSDRWKPLLQTMPESWEANANAFVVAYRQIMTATTVDPVDDALDPIADEQGVIDAVQAEYSQCDCEDDVIAAREKWEPIIARLSPANRTIAAGILVVPE